ncbi:MAG: tyrosine--tRNA ligase [Rhodoblastus sp.]
MAEGKCVRTDISSLRTQPRHIRGHQKPLRLMLQRRTCRIAPPPPRLATTGQGPKGVRLPFSRRASHVRRPVRIPSESDFLAALIERGYVHQCSDLEGLDARAKAGELISYIGYDCTAPSLHVGHLLSIMMLAWLQRTGGGRPASADGRRHDARRRSPGKDETRKILSIETIDANKAAIKRIFSKFLAFGDGRTDAVMADNAEWLTKLNYIEFLRDVGRHFSVNRMMSMDSVKLRLERDQELSFIEFNFMCLQAYDFVELNRRYGCLAQMGGSDQWGNIVTGIDLGRRMGTPQLYALTAPLHDDVVRRQDGQDGGRRRVARAGRVESLRLLAVLA